MAATRPEQIRAELSARITYHDDAAARLRAALAVLDADHAWHPNGTAAPAPRAQTAARGAGVAARRRARQATAAYLRRFTRVEPRTIAGGRDHGLGTLIRHGYLTRKADGYIRTGKRFTI